MADHYNRVAGTLYRLGRPVRFPDTPVPMKDGVALGFVRAGRIYGLRPRGGSGDCPYCGRSDPAMGGRAHGFQAAGFGKHVFACYEKALAAAGFVEGNYVAAAEAFPLYRAIRVPAAEARALSKARA